MILIKTSFGCRRKSFCNFLVSRLPLLPIPIHTLVSKKSLFMLKINSRCAISHEKGLNGFNNCKKEELFYVKRKIKSIKFNETLHSFNTFAIATKILYSNFNECDFEFCGLNSIYFAINYGVVLDEGWMLWNVWFIYFVLTR